MFVAAMDLSTAFLYALRLSLTRGNRTSQARGSGYPALEPSRAFSQSRVPGDNRLVHTASIHSAI